MPKTQLRPHASAREEATPQTAGAIHQIPPKKPPSIGVSTSEAGVAETETQEKNVRKNGLRSASAKAFARVHRKPKAEWVSAYGDFQSAAEESAHYHRPLKTFPIARDLLPLLSRLPKGIVTLRDLLLFFERGKKAKVNRAVVKLFVHGTDVTQGGIKLFQTDSGRAYFLGFAYELALAANTIPEIAYAQMLEASGAITPPVIPSSEPRAEHQKETDLLLGRSSKDEPKQITSLATSENASPTKSEREGLETLPPQDQPGKVATVSHAEPAVLVEIQTLPPAAAFRKLVIDHSRFVWGPSMTAKPRNAQEFLEGLASNPAITKLLGGVQDTRSLKERGFVKFFEGTLSPLDEVGQLRAEAAILMVILRITTEKLEAAIPPLADSMVFVDTLRQAVRADPKTAVCRNIADVLLAKHIFMLEQIKQALGDEITEEQERRLIPLLKSKDVGMQLQDRDGQWAVTVIAKAANLAESELWGWRRSNDFQGRLSPVLKIRGPQPS